MNGNESLGTLAARAMRGERGCVRRTSRSAPDGEDALKGPQRAFWRRGRCDWGFAHSRAPSALHERHKWKSPMNATRCCRRSRRGPNVGHSRDRRGATGLGIAVDAAARGYRTALVEQSDFAKGTSSRSTKLITAGSVLATRQRRPGAGGVARAGLADPERAAPGQSPLVLVRTTPGGKRLFTGSV